MQVKDVMTKEVEMLKPDATVVEAARKMKELEIGAIPINDGERIKGMVTDRDIVLKCVGEGHDVNECTVEHIMTSPIQYIYDYQSVEDAAGRMRDQKVRRLVVIDKKKNLAGIVSLGDLALTSDDDILPAQVLKSVSQGGRSAA